MNLKRTRRWRLLTIIILSIFFMMPVLFQGYLVGQESATKIEELYDQSISKNMESLSINIEFYMNHIKDFTRALSLEKGLVEALLLQENSEKEKLIREKLTSFSSFYKLRVPVYIQIITDQGEVYSDIPMYDSEVKRLLKDIETADWYDDYIPYDNTSLYIHVGTDFHDQLRDNKAIYLSKNIVYNNKHLGLLVVQMNQSLIQRLLHQVQIQSSTTVFISHENGEVLIANEENKQDLSEISTLIMEKDIKNSDIEWMNNTYFYSYRKFPSLPWHVTAITPINNLISESRDIQIYAFIMMGISGVIILSVLFILMKRVTIPILNLSTLVRNIRFGDLPEGYQYKGIEEIEILSSGINQMLNRIKNQIDQIKKDESEKRDLELNLLQSQIRPHFLHNALNSVRWMAEMKGEKSIARALISLSSMLDYSLSKSSSIWSTVAEEIEYVSNYISFQEIRLSYSIEVHCNTDEKALEAKIPKLSLQPIVENAILHGFEKLQGRKPVLKINVLKQSDVIIIRIEDNGVGMDEETANSLLFIRGSHKQDSTISGIGMINVNRRLQLEYGEPYGIHVDSTIGKGTTVTIQILNHSRREGEF